VSKTKKIVNMLADDTAAPAAARTLAKAAEQEGKLISDYLKGAGRQGDEQIGVGRWPRRTARQGPKEAIAPRQGEREEVPAQAVDTSAAFSVTVPAGVLVSRTLIGLWLCDSYQVTPRMRPTRRFRRLSRASEHAKNG
jgi:hypothetical protein